MILLGYRSHSDFFFPFIITALYDLLMFLCVLGWISQETDSEIEISMKEVYWECSVLQDQPRREREGTRERSRTGQWQKLPCNADDRDLIGSPGAGAASVVLI